MKVLFNMNIIEFLNIFLISIKFSYICTGANTFFKITIFCLIILASHKSKTTIIIIIIFYFNICKWSHIFFFILFFNIPPLWDISLYLRSTFLYNSSFLKSLCSSYSSKLSKSLNELVI